jgi:hypothetical protein
MHTDDEKTGFGNRYLFDHGEHLFLICKEISNVKSN